MVAPGGTLDGVVGVILGYSMGQHGDTVLDDFLTQYYPSDASSAPCAFSTVAAAKALGTDIGDVPSQLTAAEQSAAAKQLTGDMLAFLETSH